MWVWPGVRRGFTWVVSGMTLETVALVPKVIKVRDALNGSTIDAVIASGRGRMHRSPEKHYAPGFENYRTSTTAMLAGQFPEVRHGVAHKDCLRSPRGVTVICTRIFVFAGEVRARAWQAARLPQEGFVEWPQLLHYEPGQWYKTHRDTFHNYEVRIGSHLVMARRIRIASVNHEE